MSCAERELRTKRCSKKRIGSQERTSLFLLRPDSEGILPIKRAVGTAATNDVPHESHQTNRRTSPDESSSLEVP